MILQHREKLPLSLFDRNRPAGCGRTGRRAYALPVTLGVVGVLIIAQGPFACAPASLLDPGPADTGPRTETVTLEAGFPISNEDLAQLIASEDDGRILVVFVNPVPGPQGPAGPPGSASPPDALPVFGEVRMWAGRPDDPPPGWLPCSGMEVSRSDFADLFAVIGTRFGDGDGSTTFNLPDFRNRSPMGADGIATSGAPTTSVSGEPLTHGGAAQHVLTVHEMPTHTHPIQHVHGIEGVIYGSSGSSYIQLAGPDFEGLEPYMIESQSPNESGPAGDGAPHNNLHPYFAITYIIYARNTPLP